MSSKKTIRFALTSVISMISLAILSVSFSFAEAKGESERFEKDFVAEFKDSPDYLSMLGYVQTKVLLGAMKRVLGQGRPLNGDNIRTELMKTDVITPIGRVAFNENGDAKYYVLNMFQIQKGKWVVVYPLNVATGQAIYPAVPWKQ